MGGILSEHQHSPTAVFGAGYGSWNVTADPYIDDGQESPLWAFARSRAFNRLALRTKLKVVTASEQSDGAESVTPLSDEPPSPSGGAIAYLKHDSLGPYGD